MVFRLELRVGIFNGPVKPLPGMTKNCSFGSAKTQGGSDPLIKLRGTVPLATSESMLGNCLVQYLELLRPSMSKPIMLEAKQIVDGSDPEKQLSYILREDNKGIAKTAGLISPVKLLSPTLRILRALQSTSLVPNWGCRGTGPLPRIWLP